jgi:hypothetical protein
MDITFEMVIYYLVLIDAISAVIAAWTGYGAKMNARYSIFAHHFPITKGWTTYYLVLIIWLGCALARLGIII